MRLTDLTIRAFEVPKTGAQIYYDSLVPGFGVRVSEGGTKSFVLTHGIRRHRETIGRVGVLSLQEARSEAKRRLAEYTLGKKTITSVAWNTSLEEYLDEVASKRRPRTVEDYRYLLNRHFRYGATKVAEITPHDIQMSLNKLRGTPGVEQHAFVALRAFVRWNYRRHYIDLNPMERMLPPHEYVPRDRVLNFDELARVWDTADDFGSFGKLVKLLILTGQRRGEICHLTGGMVMRDTITLPATLTKNGLQHTIPLGDTVRSILRPPKPRDELFLMALGKTTPLNGFSKSKAKLDAASNVHDWTLHDLRRTFASGLASIGVQLSVIERLLNHVSGSFGGIVGVYQRYDFMPEMRDAIGRWEDRIATTAAGPTGLEPVTRPL